MEFIKHLIWIFMLVYECHTVPPNPMDRLLEELMSAKTMMTNIAAQLEKFNSLYLLKLEQRMNSMSGTLSSLDSNIKNLQERAHVWDTFQLHVAAWNEHINTLDKKVDIISRGQEKMLILENKLNSITNIEYKTERIIGKLDDNLSTLQTIVKIVENQNHDPLLSEFTTRGVLSTLKTIERKLDKLQAQQTNSQSMLAKQINDNKKKSNTSADFEQKNKLLIKCNTPPLVEELLTDVASKVDVMFDKFTSADEQNDDSAADDQRESSNSDVSQETKSDPDLKLIKNLLKRLNQPCKRTIKVLENLENSIKIIDNTTITILEDGQITHSDLLNYCKNTDRKLQTVSDSASDVIHKVEQMLTILQEKLIPNKETISDYFTEQREHFAEILRSELNNLICTDRTGNKDIFPKQNIDFPVYNSTEPAESFNEPTISSDKLNCEELQLHESSGVYILGKSEYKNSANRGYNIRYCEIREDGAWTVIQRRGINPHLQTFNLSWSEYKNGFGALDKDFWFGNDFIHNLSDEKQLMLRVELEDFEGNTAWAEYNTFLVMNEDENYKLFIGGYTGNASDSFSTHNNSSFSTYDRTNDNAPTCCPCAPSYGGGWWFYSCFEVNLNGIYYDISRTNDYFKGLIWEHWLGNYSLKKTKMLLRPRSNIENEVGSGTEPDIDDPLHIPEDP